MKKKMPWISALSMAGLLLSAAVYRYTSSPVLFSPAITFGTVFYHCYNRHRLMRLLRRSYTKPQVN